jgi:hypothetical protein
VVDEIPPPQEVQVVEQQGAIGSGEWTGVISRNGTGERVACATRFPPTWNGAIVVLGRAGEKDVAGSGVAVISFDQFNGWQKPASTRDQPKVPYLGYQLGYNRSLLAERVHDFLSVIAFARGFAGIKSVRIVASGDAAPAALVASAIAGDAISSSQIDLGGFDFDQVHDEADPRLLAGAVKYGGAGAMLQLCNGMRR